LDTSCDSHPIPAAKVLASHRRSDRGACGFVLVVNPDRTAFWGVTSGLAVTHPEPESGEVTVSRERTKK
jgi:hypothetical protein